MGKFKCQVCGKSTNLCCPKCKKVFYCTYEHQKQHWKIHSKLCEGIIIQKKVTHVETVGDTYQTKIILRNNLRKELFQYYAQGKYQECLLISKKLQLNAVKIIDKTKSRNEFSECIVDILVIIKIHLKLKEHDAARKYLDNVFETYGKNLQQFIGLVSGKVKADQIQFLKQKCSLLSTIANLFYACSQFKKCQQCYIKYSKLVELAFGKNSLEVSNCFFMLGVFYYQNIKLAKSLACFKRCLQIRNSQLGENFDSVIDCYYNIAIVQRAIGRNLKAIQNIQKVIYLRKQINDMSIPIGQALQTLGIIYMEQDDYRAALNKFQECYLIRKRLITEENPEFKKIQNLIIEFYRRLKEFIKKKEQNGQKVKIETMVQKNIEQNLFFNNRIKDNIKQIKNLKEASLSEQELILNLQLSHQNDQTNLIDTKRKESQQNFKLQIDQELMGMMNSSELYFLGELQLKNSEKISIYQKLDNIENSQFLKIASNQVRNKLQQLNKQIFQDLILKKQ